VLPVRQFLAQISITEMEHPPCHPDLALKEFWLLTEIKCDLKGRIFQGAENKKM
jgi:hypothetical protein